MSIKRILKDAAIQTLRNQIAGGRFNLDVNALIVEVGTLHKTNAARTLTRKILARDNKRLLDALFANQAVRSRLVEIKTSSWLCSKDLSDYLDALNKHLKGKYRSELTEFKTVAERDQQIKFSLSEFYTLLQSFEKLDGYLDVVLEDIDQQHWTLKAIRDTVAMDYERKM
jgi:hypothetical protein